jgi:glutamate N-acetyltransferase / amino-acid N-acetyltransferase
MHKFIDNGSVTSAPGFNAAGIFCGIKKRKKDLAIIYSETPCAVAGTFTLNKVKAAPLLVTQSVVKNGEKVKAVLINSGNANACTGEQGLNDALYMQSLCAEKLGLNKNEVLIASTGVIGQRLPIQALQNGICEITKCIDNDGGLNAAEAIMTTDKIIKSFAVKVMLPSGTVTIGAICKGSGMIMPNMATMLAFITTDASLDQILLQEILSECVNNSFNKISVDGETSTNDMVLILANGKSEIFIKKTSIDYELFKIALQAICIEMAKSIVADGEGATKLVTIKVKNAKSQYDANLVGKSIANSSLVKTAIHGADANWGRILCAAGQSGADFDPANVMISFDELPVLLPNYDLALDEAKAREILLKSEFIINIDLGIGEENSTWWTCDLTEDYVKINAEYRT